MEIQTKFNLGDRPWLISQHKPKVWHPCSFCGGSDHYIDWMDGDEPTKVVGLNGEEKECPVCRGRGGEYKYMDMEWYVRGQITVRRIGMNIYADELDRENEESYMEAASGSIYYADKLFVTKEEAQAECAKRNNA